MLGALADPKVFLLGTLLGFIVAGAVAFGTFAILDAQERRTRRAVLGFATRALWNALEVLVGESPSAQARRCRDLAAAVNRVAQVRDSEYVGRAFRSMPATHFGGCRPGISESCRPLFGPIPKWAAGMPRCG